jgi:hypothetical protein
MKVTVELDGGGYGAEKDPLKAVGFLLTIGGYSDPASMRVKMGFDEGLALLTELVGKAKDHHDAVAKRLGETGRLAAFGAAISAGEAL